MRSKQRTIINWRLCLLVLLASALSFGFNGQCNLADDSGSGSSPVLIIKANSHNTIHGHESGPDSELNVPSEAIDNDIEISFSPFRNKNDMPEPLPYGCEFLGGANLTPKHQDNVNFHSGKEADCYVILPNNVRAEELSNTDIRLMEFIDGQWVIVLPDKKGTVHTEGPKTGYIGPDESSPAKLTGIRPFCWAIITDPAVIQSLYNLWLAISADSTTGGAVPIIPVPPALIPSPPSTPPVIVTPPAVIVPPTSTTGPIAWWKFDDIEGSAAFDSSGNNNHGRVYGAAWNSNTLSFDGANDCVKVPDSPILRPARITVEAWVKPGRISQAVLLEKTVSGEYPPLRGWQIFLDTAPGENHDTVCVWIGNGLEYRTAFNGKTVIQADKWYHIAMTYDGASLNLYINGALEGSKPNTTGIGDNSAASLTIGYSGYWNYNYFNGLMHNAKIYNYARSAEEIQANYNASDRAVDDYIWATNYSSNNVIRIKRSDSITTSITAGTGSRGIAVDESYCWVVNQGSNNVTRIQKSDLTTATITAGNTPLGIAVDETYAWVANYISNNVTRINKSNLTTVTITVGANPAGVAVDGTYAWVANSGSSNITRIKKSDSTTTAIAVGSGPSGIAVDELYCWVSNSSSNTVTRILKSDVSQKTTISSITLPTGIAADETYCWVSSNDNTNVVRIKKSDLTMTNISVGDVTSSEGNGLSVDNTYVWVANYGGGSGNTVTRILKSDLTTTNITVGTGPLSLGDMTGYAYDNYAKEP